jgi:hypothetical protein
MGLISNYREMVRFQKLDRSERNIVFYAESESYWGYLYPFIRSLIEEHGKSVCYLTSSPSDPVLEGKIPEIRPFYIHKGSIRTILFSSLDADIMVMTLPDLGKYSLKRSKYPVHYVFVPHNMNSTHMVFNKGAHNAFDTIFCVGPHHLAELREAERIYDLPPRMLVESGYVKLDALCEEVKRRGPPSSVCRRQVFIAPSWPPHSLLEIIGVELIEVLLSSGYTVVVRPHRDTLRVHFDVLRNQFGDRKDFILDEGKFGGNAFYESDLLITDWSGSAFSFAFSRERPVLYIDVPNKVLNKEYKRFSQPPLETTIREEIGVVLKPEQVSEVPEYIEALCGNSDEWAEKIRIQRHRWVYNLGSSAKSGAAYLAKLAAEGKLYQQQHK